MSETPFPQQRPYSDNSTLRGWLWSGGLDAETCVLVFHADDFIAFEGDEGNFAGRRAVNPVLRIDAVFRFAKFFIGMAEGERDLLAVHAEHGAFLGDRFPEGGREG